MAFNDSEFSFEIMGTLERSQLAKQDGLQI